MKGVLCSPSVLVLKKKKIFLAELWFFFPVFALAQLQQCIAVSQKASEKIFQFYRDSVRRRYSKMLEWRTHKAFFIVCSFFSFFLPLCVSNGVVIKKNKANNHFGLPLIQFRCTELLCECSERFVAGGDGHLGICEKTRLNCDWRCKNVFLKKRED